MADANLESQKALLNALKTQVEQIEQQKGEMLLLASSVASAQATLENGNQGSNITEKTVAKISEAVEKIVSNVLSQDYGKSACIAFLTTKVDDMGQLKGEADILTYKISTLQKQLQISGLKSAEISKKEEEMDSFIKERAVANQYTILLKRLSKHAKR